MEDCAVRVLALFFASTLAVCAQSSWKAWRFQLPDGAYVSFVSGETILSSPAGVSFFAAPDLTGKARLYGNTIEHVIEEEGRTVLAYRLRIEPVREAAYLLAVEPIAGSPFFSQAPQPFKILDGQRAEIDLAMSKDGHVKAFASIQATKYERRLSNMPAQMVEARDLTLGALQLMVSDAQVFKNNIRIAEHAGGASGGVLVAYLPGVGRVFFSLLPRKDFGLAKTALVDDNRIVFNIGSDRYEIASKGSVIGQPGPWWIYMLRAPDAAPCNRNVGPFQPFIWAQTLTREWLNCQAQ
jgi:hypothetical protein